MRSEKEIQRDVEQELEWHPDLSRDHVAVGVQDGMVALAGFGGSFVDKYEAEQATKRVGGVTAIANDLAVRLPEFDERPDPDIARGSRARGVVDPTGDPSHRSALGPEGDGMGMRRREA